MILIVSAVLGFSRDGSESKSEGVLEDEEEEVSNEDGLDITCDEGNSGSLQIPMVGINVIESHEKHHWNMPEEKKMINATLSWTDTSWELKFSIGIGDCPDNGEVMTSETSKSGTIELFFEGDSLSEEQWFAHVETTDPQNHRGESCAYEFEITLY